MLFKLWYGSTNHRQTPSHPFIALGTNVLLGNVFFSFLDIFDIELGVTVRGENGVGLPRTSEQKFHSRVRCSMEISIVLNIHCLFWM